MEIKKFPPYIKGVGIGGSSLCQTCKNNPNKNGGCTSPIDRNGKLQEETLPCGYTIIVCDNHTPIQPSSN